MLPQSRTESDKADSVTDTTVTRIVSGRRAQPVRVEAAAAAATGPLAGPGRSWDDDYGCQCLSGSECPLMMAWSPAGCRVISSWTEHHDNDHDRRRVVARPEEKFSCSPSHRDGPPSHAGAALRTGVAKRISESVAGAAHQLGARPSIFGADAPRRPPCLISSNFGPKFASLGPNKLSKGRD
jgi:hypothetical protein